MEINRKDAKNSIKLMVDYVRRGNFDDLFLRISYLTGLYGAFYTVAMMDELDLVDRQRFVEELQKRADPKIIE